MRCNAFYGKADHNSISSYDMSCHPIVSQKPSPSALIASPSLALAPPEPTDALTIASSSVTLIISASVSSGVISPTKTENSQSMEPITRPSRIKGKTKIVTIFRRTRNVESVNPPHYRNHDTILRSIIIRSFGCLGRTKRGRIFLKNNRDLVNPDRI
mmetsp:Transcript_34170/g.39318  ORF Transcript_34170/g.39318 Transcript_34170/m.39318 type:complete len:157 (+) Transcript_34170:166-636(+)